MRAGYSGTPLSKKLGIEEGASVAVIGGPKNFAGVVWVSWPKKSAKVETDITEDVIREVALPIGFVDVKVCAVDETWSGLN